MSLTQISVCVSRGAVTWRPDFRGQPAPGEGCVDTGAAVPPPQGGQEEMPTRPDLDLSHRPSSPGDVPLNVELR